MDRAVVNGDDARRASVLLDGPATVGTLTITSSDQLTIASGGALNVASAIANLGTIMLSGDAGTVALLSAQLPDAGDLILSGGGTLVLQGAARVGGGGRLINSGNTITGNGAIGENAIGVLNGVGQIIEAKAGASTELTLDPALASGLINLGTLRAWSGGILVLNGAGGGTFNNASGLIQALDGSAVRLTAGAEVVGGTLATSGTGVIRIDGDQIATLADVTLAGNVLIAGEGRARLSGTISNIAAITASASPWAIEPIADVMLSGGGVLNMNRALIRGDGRFINVDNTIRGSGSIGGFSPGFVNHSLIHADVWNEGIWLFTGYNGIAARNDGVIRATDGSTIVLTRVSTGSIAFLDNSGGTIEALGSGRIWLQRGAEVRGGTLSATMGAKIGVTSWESATLGDLTLRGYLSVGARSQLWLAGTIENRGTIDLHTDQPGERVDLLATSGQTTTLTGAGVIRLRGGAVVGGSGSWVNVDNLLSGGGSLGDGSASIVNGVSGVIEAGSGSNLLIQPGAGGFLNVGLVRAAPNGTLTIADSARLRNYLAGFLAGGSWHVASPASIVFADGAGITRSTATITLSGPGAQFPALSGLTDNSGVLVLQAGRAFITQSTLDNSGTVTIDASSSLVVRGDLANSGTIDVNNGMVVDYPATGSSALPVVVEQIRRTRQGGNWNAPAITSTHAAADPTGAGALAAIEAADYLARYGAGTPFLGHAIDDSSVLVRLTRYGDADVSGDVGFDDYVALDQGFLSRESGWWNGDFDYNGIVDFDDYVLIDLAFNAQNGTLRRAMRFLDGSDRSRGDMSAPGLRLVLTHFDRFGLDYAAHFLSAVPEPGGVGTAGLAGGLCVAGRRDRRSRRR